MGARLGYPGGDRCRLRERGARSGGKPQARLSLQIRSRVLNGGVEDAFRRRGFGFRPEQVA